MKPLKLLTTGDVARLCGFSPSAVLQWIRSGKLEAYSSPGGQHRVDPGNLLCFLKAHKMRIPSELAPQSDGYRILIVDHNNTLGDILRNALTESRIPCAVDVARNGVIGCMKIPTFKPDLILLDITMRELDCVEMCRAVKGSQELAHTRVLLVTGHDDNGRRNEALKAGADDWIAKPLSASRLLAKVAETLGIENSAESAPAGDSLAWTEEVV